MTMAIDEKSLPRLREYLASRGFTDKYFQTSQLINKFDSVTDIQQNLSVLKILYEDFLYEYPFNHTYWTKYAAFYIKIQQYEVALQMYHNYNYVFVKIQSYEEAVSMNPASPELWLSYISFVVQNYEKTPEKVIEVYEKAIKNVQYDVNAHLIWDSYLAFLEPRDPNKAHELYWRLLNYTVSGHNEIYQRYEAFVNALDEIKFQEFVSLHPDLPLPPGANENKVAVQQVYAQKIKEAAASNLPADSEKRLHELLEKTEFDGEEFDAAKDEALKEYLNYQERAVGYEKTIYLYRKALVVKCKSGDFWTKFLYFLEKDQNTQPEVGVTLKKYAKHFNIIENKEQVSFFQADLHEGNNDLGTSREIYKALEQKKVFEAYLRHLYLEIRSNNVQNVVDVFVSLSQVVQDGDQIAFVVQEMGDIFNKLGEVEKASEIIRQFHDRDEKYSKFFYISWVNFLKNCKKPWEEIEAVFKYAFDKAKEAADKEALWKVYVYTARSYCSDIIVLRDVERRYFMKEEPTDQVIQNGVNSKRLYDDVQDTNEEESDAIRKQLKTDQ